MSVFRVFIAVALLLVALFETETLPIGIMEGREQVEFGLVFFMELITVCLIPLALRLFKFKKVEADLKRHGAVALRKWGILRLLMLLLPLMKNTLLYYLFMNTTFGYMAIIVLLTTPFVYPSMSRCLSEVE